MTRKSLRAGILVCAATAAAAFSVSAFDWPADAGDYRYGFGSPRGGFLRGVEFGEEDGMVRAADDGELTFVAEGRCLPGGYPLSGGSLLVVAHASDMTTIYAGLRQGSISAYLKNVRKGDVLGRSDKAKSGRGVSFYTFDARERRFINPLIVMPGLDDKKAPAIRSVALDLDGFETPIDPSMPVRQGSYHILVEAHDASPVGEPGAPFELRVLIDGSERTRVVYDAAWATGGRALLFGGKGLEEGTFLTDDGRMRFGPFTLPRGRVVLTIVVSDYAGNTREQTYSVSVQ